MNRRLDPLHVDTGAVGSRVLRDRLAADAVRRRRVRLAVLVALVAVFVAVFVYVFGLALS